jgi:3-hydroxyacyl-CoA dehydrogenase
MSLVAYSVADGVAVLEMANPPVNSLGWRLCMELVDALERAAGDASVEAIVLHGGASFSAGADIREFEGASAGTAPILRTLIEVLDASPKPVCAAISGVALGGGLELAMGCHYRIAHASAKLGLPEVKLGLLPGAGGTQRLPRLIGVENALNVILGGEPLPARLFAGSPLLDAVVDDDHVAAARRFVLERARDARARRSGWPRARDRDLREPRLEALLQFARNGARTGFPQYPAPIRCIDAVGAAATLDFDAGMDREYELFMELFTSPVSLALRHAFFAERAAAKIADLPEGTRTREIRTAAVIGSGTMGTGIAICFINAGIPVALLDVKAEALERGVAKIRETFEGQAKKGRLKPEQVGTKMALLSQATDYATIAEADIVIEAVFEDMAVKEKVFRQLDATMKRGAILATNTSTLDVDRIAAFTGRPEDVVGTHFFSPANVMRLLEVVRGKATSHEVLATTMKLAKTLRKTGVVSGVCDGFIGNRMIEQYSRQAFLLLDEGASPQQVDAAIESFGFAMGPFRMSDLAGNDIGWHIRQRRYAEQPQMFYSKVADRLYELGRYGQKTGAGWYDYRPGDRTAHPSAVVDEMIAAHRAAIGLAPRRIPAREIVDRLLLSLVNEGAQILEEGIAQRSSDIDMVYLTGYGFPLWRGGPMFWADHCGLYDVMHRMKRLARNPHGDPGFWKPAPLLERLALAGGRFSGWKGEKS